MILQFLDVADKSFAFERGQHFVYTISPLAFVPELLFSLNHFLY